MSMLRDALLGGAHAISRDDQKASSSADNTENRFAATLSEHGPDSVASVTQTCFENGKDSASEMVVEASVGYDGLIPKEAKAIQEDFRMCKHELGHCDAMLESLASAPDQTKSDKLFKQRQINAITRKKTNKIEHLKRLSARLKALHEQHIKDIASPFKVPGSNVMASPQRYSTPLIPPPAQMSDISNASTGRATPSRNQTMLISAPVQNTGDAHSGDDKKSKFHVDRRRIQAVESKEQDAELQQLGLTVYNQDDFEQGVIDQVDEAMAADEEMRLNKVMEKEMKAIQDDVKSCQQEVTHCEQVLETLIPNQVTDKDTRRRIDAVNRQKENKMQHLKRLKARQKALYQRMVKSIQELDGGITSPKHQTNDATPLALPLDQLTHHSETQEERMIRLGEMTPFGTVMTPQEPSTSAQMSSFEKYLLDQNEKSGHRHKPKVKRRRSSVSSSIAASETSSVTQQSLATTKTASRSNNKANFFDGKDTNAYRPAEKDFSNYLPRKRQLHSELVHNFSGDRHGSDVEFGDEIDEDDYVNQFKDQTYVPPHERELESDQDTGPSSKKKRKRNNKKVTSHLDEEVDLGELKAQYGVKKKAHSGGTTVKGSRSKDDGTRELYQMRIRAWRKQRLIQKQARIEAGEPDSSDDSDIEYDGLFKVPAQIWKKLYRYQKTGVKWLWELHAQHCGGIVGDEMGLGKTIQVIAFLVALKHSQLRDKGVNRKYVGLGPVIIVCPITVMHQWVKEFHKWWPSFRVGVLHSSGSYAGRESRLVREIIADNGVLITSYSHTVIHQDLLLQYDWHYIVLDEGHKIRNPDAQVTIAVKQFRTCHRLILSGSPMQNNLKELWSLFDFVFPGKLGTLPDFMAHFSVPITLGGYANATQVQVTTAYKCACILRDSINPYLLRRMKNDVKVSLDLPQKNEQVLFCRLTQHQRDVYQEYLDSKECQQILSGNYMAFPGLITLRKICNHPDLSTGGPVMFDRYDVQETSRDSQEYGHHSRSGKLIVVESLLKIWKKQGHRVLLFTQGTQMMDILERFVRSQGYNYMRMDGQTSVASRQPLVNKFNEDPSVFVFLLTTRVGGLGVNLTGADRVVIFDPDWNPSTDIQAKERAWRIGQTKQVTIYRLITTGTIEEKIYHRQIFKQFLTNRVLKDPKQRRFFKSNDLFELFTLGNDDLEIGTETSAIFAGTGSDVKVKLKSINDKKSDGERTTNRKNRFDLLRESTDSKDDDPDIDMSGNDDLDWDREKLNRMKELAKKLSQQLSASKRSKSKDSDETVNSNSAENTIDSLCVTREETSLNGLKHDSTVDEPDDKSNKQPNSKRTHVNEAQQPKSKDILIPQRERHGDVKNDKERGKKRKERERKEKERKRMKKKRRCKRTMFEGERVAHLTGHRTHKPHDEDENKPSNDDYVLQTLFSKSGVHSAMQHDTIMQSSDPDYALVEGEAERVAQEAAMALRVSRSACNSASSGVPTWTGSSGVLSKPRFGQKKNSSLTSLSSKQAEKKEEQKKKVKPAVQQAALFAPDPVKSHHFDGSIAGNVKQNSGLGKASKNVMSSSDLLRKMRARNFAGKASDSHEIPNDEDGFVPSSNSAIEADPAYLELITDIRNFVAFCARVDGQASTQELLDEFGSRLPAQDSAKFKAMLKQLCTLSKDSGVGVWYLKPEFR